MQTTFAQTGTDARAWLNDVDVVGGEIFTDSVLKPFRERAYNELYQTLVTFQVPNINRVIYWVLPAYTTYLSPGGTIGLQDFAEPVFVEERGNITTVNIATTSTSSPILVTTASAHGLSNSQSVTITGVSGTTSPWGRFFVTVVSPTTFTLNGSVSDGNAGTGGVICYGQDSFTPVDAQLRTNDSQATNVLGTYLWMDETLWFNGATVPRELRITYRASSVPPTQVNQPLGIDDIRSFMGARTAALAAQSKQWTDTYQRLSQLACGPSMLPDGTGGDLRNIMSTMVIAMQRNQRQRGRFRPRYKITEWLYW